MTIEEKINRIRQILNEAAEEELFMQALEASSDQLEQLLPPEVVDFIKGQENEGLEEFKTFVVERLSRKINIFGLSEKRKQWLVESLVGSVLDALLDDTELEMNLMTPGERRAKLMERTPSLTHPLEISRRKYDQDKRKFEAQIDAIDAELQDIESTP